jgi:hypothetical protein
MLSPRLLSFSTGKNVNSFMVRSKAGLVFNQQKRKRIYYADGWSACLQEPEMDVARYS